MVNEARKDIYQARLTLREQRIFMQPEITKNFSDVIERMHSVRVERQVALENPGAGDLWKDSAEWLKGSVPAFEEVATKANRRLFREEREMTRNQ
jgi:hypothetical protein